MGRAKKYLTDEEQKRALKERQQKYYRRNMATIRARNLDTYHQKKLTNSSGSVSLV
jgi:hypothetical protein